MAAMGREETMMMTHRMTLTTVTITDVLLNFKTDIQRKKRNKKNKFWETNKVVSGLRDPRDNGLDLVAT